jgi:CubicO group peptidase (beta-lactamase class C family)
MRDVKEADTLAAVVEREMARWTVPGIVVGTLRDGVVETRAWGTANLNTGWPMHPNALVRVASISKVFTATLAMTFVDEGRIDLDTPVIEYLPGLRLADAAARERITMRHLLSHGSGLHGDFVVDKGQGEDALADAVGEFHTLRQVYQPDELWAYTNSGFHLAGRVIEVVAGQPFDAAMRARVFAPLGLERTGFFAHEMIVWPHAVGHDPLAPGTDEQRVAKQYYPRNRFPAGGVISNAPDLLRFAAFHMSDGTVDGRRVLSEASLRAMREPQRRAAGWAEAWGIGWDMRRVDGVQVVAHGGSINGFRTQLTVVPQRRFACAILTNSGRGTSAIRPIERWLLEHACGLHVADPPLVELAPATLARYAGQYTHPDADITLTVADDGLRLEARSSWPGVEGRIDLPPEQLAPIGEREFLIEEGERAGNRIDVILHADGAPRFLRMGGRLYDAGGQHQREAARP